MLASLACLVALTRQDSEAQLPAVEMGKAQLVFFVVPKKAPDDAAEDGTLLQQHLKFLEGLWDRRTALLVGPLEGAGRLAGICLVDVPSSDEARKVLSEDPLVKAGRLELETHTWFFAKNYVKKGKQFLDLGQYWFGLLERPGDAAPLSTEQATKMQEGHMANISKMAEKRALVLAGPMVEDTPLRGIFVFKGLPKEQVLDLTAPDPLIAAGRLKLSLYRWRTSKGSFLLDP